jgi:DNA-binding CsgD family transcriptional regulator
MAMSAALACEQSARRIKACKIEARAVSAQAMINGITADRDATFAAAERAEAIAPGDREVLFATWCLDRVTASLFSDDISRAIEESMVGRAYAGDISLDPPLRPWGFYAILQAVAGLDGRGAIQEAREAGAAVGRGWTQGLLAYSEAVLEGREGHPVRATALAEAGRVQLAPFAAWWNHLVRRLVATAALEDGWGQPAAWLREATAEFQASGHDRLASACRGMLRKAGERVPRSGRGEARVPAQMRRLGVTSREMDVYLLVAQGLSNAEIADRLFISPKTVETHVASLVSKTGQAGRRELVAHAARSAQHLIGLTELTQDSTGISSGLARCAPACG